MKSLFRFPKTIGWRDHLVGAALAIGVTYWLMATSSAIGFARDEGFYFRAATDYARWFQLLASEPLAAFERVNVDKIWDYNHEHPSLIKSLFALSWWLLYEKYKLFAHTSDAIRFPAMALSGIAAWVTYLFGARVFSRGAGLTAAALALLTPRVFYHAHLACFDMPIVAMWTLCIYVYWRSLERQTIGWALLAGLVFGLALETKHNAWILPLVFACHGVVVVRERLRDGWSIRPPTIPLSWFTMPILGPLVFLALWPWMWFDTVARFKEYFVFHFDHVYYNMEFLGKNYFDAPSPLGYMPLMLVGTVPTITLVLFAIGAGSHVPRLLQGIGKFFRRSSPTHESVGTASYPTLLLFIAIGAALGPWFLTKTPIFGGTKHWITAYPFMAIFAGHGLVLAWRRIDTALYTQGRILVKSLQIALCVLVIAPPLAITIHSHPLGLTAYVPAIGGIRGAATLGLNRQFWGYTTQDACTQYINEHAPRNASLFIHDTAWESWTRMVSEGRVRRDLRAFGAPGQAIISLIHHELHMNEVEFQIWTAYETRAPKYIVTQDEVPIVSIYEPPKPSEKGKKSKLNRRENLLRKPISP